MKKIVYTFIITTFLIIATKTGKAQINPVAEAVFERIEKTYTLNKDGSQEYRCYKKMKYNTLNSLHNLYGETFIAYNTEYQDIKINKSITVKADGAIVETPQNAFNYQLPSFAAKAPAYNHLKELVVTHTALEIGAVIELDYTITTKPDFYPFFDQVILFREDVPVNEYVVTVKVPEGTNLNNAINATTINAKPANEGEMSIYTWNVKNISGSSKDAYMPLAELNALTLIFSTVDSFSQALSRIVNQPAFEQQTLPPSAKKAVENIVQNNRLELIQILEIQKYVINNINSVAIPDRLLGYHFATPEVVWNRNYGTEAEKAILMSLMLKQAGFDAYPSYITYDNFFRMGIASLSAFYQWVVKIMQADGKPLYISPSFTTPMNMKYTYLENSIAFPLNATVETLCPDIFSEILPFNNLSGNLIIHADNSLTGTLDMKLEAPMNPYFSIEQDNNYVKKILAGIFEKSIADPKKPKISEQKTEVTLNISQTDVCDVNGDYYFFTLPEIKPAADAASKNELPTQRNSYFQIQPQRTFTSLKITIPDNFELVSPTINKESRKSFGFYRIEINLEKKSVTINRQFEVADQIIIPIHYPALKNFLIEWNDPIYRQLIFKKINK